MHNQVPLPTGPEWHVTLLDRFRTPPSARLPLLFDEALAAEMDVFRRFRHVARAGYGVELDWEKLAVGLSRAIPVFERFQSAVTEYLDDLE